jgi:hypothetical protein
MPRRSRSAKGPASSAPDGSSCGAVLIIGPLDKCLLAAAELIVRAHRLILRETTADGAHHRSVNSASTWCFSRESLRRTSRRSCSTRCPQGWP